MWQVISLDSVTSTNDEVKARALAGAPAGLAVVARTQTAGRGRRGRTFQSPAGKGLYLSVLLRLQGPVEAVGQLTAWSAVAVCRAVERASSGGLEDGGPLSLGIKWPNDVLAEGKKLCGILTEFVAPDAVVIGMGVNLSQTAADFGPALADKAVSLTQLGVDVKVEDLTAALLTELEALAAFPQGRADFLAHYRRRCATLGREVRLVAPDGERAATALDVDENFGLRVRLDSGGEETVTSGEVSVRGLLGYV